MTKKNFHVTADITVHSEIFVEAENEEQAIEMAGDPVDWDVVSVYDFNSDPEATEY